MRPHRAAGLLVLLGVLVVLLTAVRVVTAPATAAPDRADHVVVVGVSGLEWSDLTPQAMPRLWAAAGDGAIGTLSVRGARSTTCPWDGWVTLGAGERARYPAAVRESQLPSPRSDGVTGCLGQTGAPPTDAGSALAPAVSANADAGYAAVPGLLGTSVSCTTVVGDGPVLAVGADGADVRPVAAPGSGPDAAAAWGALALRCPLTLVAPAAGLTGAALDRLLGAVLDGARATGGTVVVAGISQAAYGPSQVRPVVAVGTGLDGGLLGSPSTGRPGLAQLVDLAPTVLTVLGQDVPIAMGGQPMTTTARDEPLAATVDDLRAEARAATYREPAADLTFLLLTVVLGVALLGALAVLTWRPRWLPALRYAGTVLGLVPVSTFLADLLPWWRADSPGVALAGAVAAALAVTSAVALLGPWRRHASGPPLAAAVLTVVVLATDVLTGSHLQLDSPLGYDPVVAGRFTGFGNLAFAAYAAGGLAAVAAATRLAGWRRRWITAVVASLGLALVVVDGAPRVGADFGGVVALVPALLVLWMMVARVQISWHRLVLSLVGGVVVVVGIAVLDFLRPAGEQTHLGRFVGQVLDGTAGTVLRRKLTSNLHLLTGSVLTVLVVVMLAVVALLWFRRDERPGRVAWGYLREHTPYVAAGLSAIGIAAVVGFAVNDSGIAVTAIALAVALPLFLASLSGSDPAPPLLSAGPDEA